MATWYDMLKAEFAEAGDDFSSMISTLSAGDLHRDFDDGYGTSKGTPFTAWGEKFVYFPVVYDGAEWVGRAPRNPCDIATDHQGGQ